MSAGTPLLSRLRGSLVGAWLAAAYGLAVLAAGLAPAPAHPVVEGAVLCSGLAAPTADEPAPAGDGDHCKGCPAGSAPALVSVPHGVLICRQALPAALAAILSAGVVAAPGWRLPPSHAPPRLPA